MSRFLKQIESLSPTCILTSLHYFPAPFPCLSLGLLYHMWSLLHTGEIENMGNIKCFSSRFQDYSFLIIYFLFFSLGHISRHLSLSSRRQHLLMGSFRQLWAWKLHWTDPSVCTCQPRRRMPGNGLDCLDKCFLASELVLVASVYETKTSLACLELNIWY